MVDYELKVGFDTSSLDRIKTEFQNLCSAGIGGSSSASSATNNISKGTSSGFVSAVRGLGLVTLFSNLKTISETLFVLSAVANALLAMAFIGVSNFFMDPFRALLQLGIFIVNGVLSGIEFLINFTARQTEKRFGLNQGTLGTVELPRIQTDLALEAYDQFRTALREADGNAAKSAQAGIQYIQGIANSFQKNSDRIAEQEKLLADSINLTQQNQSSTVSTINSLFTEVGTTFSAASPMGFSIFLAAQTMKRLFDDINRNFGNIKPRNNNDNNNNNNNNDGGGGDDSTISKLFKYGGAVSRQIFVSR